MIYSVTNSIQRIKLCNDRLCGQYGRYLEFKDRHDVSSFLRGLIRYLKSFYYIHKNPPVAEEVMTIGEGEWS